MRLLIDGRMINSSGIGVYIKNVIREFALKSEVNISVLLYPHEVVTIPEYVKRIDINYSQLSMLNILKLGRITRNYDVFFCPNMVLMPLNFGRCRFISTVHDLCPVRMRDCFPIHLSLLYWLIIFWQCINSAKIFCISQFTKKELKHYLPFIRDSKISTIYNGWNKKRCDVVSTVKTAQSRQYGICVGNVKKHKNIIPLVKYLSEHSVDCDIYIVGDYKNFRSKVIDELPTENSNVIFTGYISDEKLDELYRGAKFFLYPSRYEGFGLPLLEAMAYKLPILASDIEVFHELAGDAISYFDPITFIGLDEKINNVLNEKHKKNYNSVIDFFSWEKTVNEMEQVMNESIND